MPRNFWLGVRASQTTFGFDEDTPFYTPLLRAQAEKGKSYSEGRPYEDGVDFAFGYPPIKVWNGPCLFVKATSGYVTRDSNCNKENTFFCKWRGNFHTRLVLEGSFYYFTGLECPTGYQTYGHASDGQRCWKLSTEHSNLTHDVCDVPGIDRIRSLALLDDLYTTEAFLFDVR